MKEAASLPLHSSRQRDKVGKAVVRISAEHDTRLLLCSLQYCHCMNTSSFKYHLHLGIYVNTEKKPLCFSLAEELDVLIQACSYPAFGTRADRGISGAV